jgi:hypothetical protein
MRFLDLNITSKDIETAVAESSWYVPPSDGLNKLFTATEELFEHDICCSDKTGYVVLPKPSSEFAVNGHMLYPPGGYMSWHTNSNKPGLRVYAVWSETGDSGMLWRKNGRIVVDNDKPGWNVRAFVAPCWHAVWSKCYRISFGVSL